MRELCSSERIPGLGNMGSGMAANLVRKGHPVVVYDVTPGAASQLGTDIVKYTHKGRFQLNFKNRIIVS